MSTRAVLRHETWTLVPDREPDAVPTTYAMTCAVCGKTSPVSVDFAEPQTWVFRHVARNPSHHTFGEVITRPWRAWMGRA